MKISEMLTIKTLTNRGERCKTRCCVVGNNKDDVGLLIDRLVLSREDVPDFEAVKTFGEYKLWHNGIGIRLDTLQTINHWLRTLNLKEEFK